MPASSNPRPNPADPPEADLRPAVERMTKALRPAAEGDLSVRLEAPSDDPSLIALADAVNATLEIAQRSAARVAEQDALLKQRSAEAEEFAYVASHDLQEPLRMIASFLQLLERRHGDKLESDAQEYVAFAVDGAQRMQQLIRDLLAYSRISTQGEPLARVESADVLQRALAQVDHTLDAAGGSVETGPLPPVWGDARQLVVLFKHLLSNAITFRRAAPPSIRVTAEREGRFWKFEVRDNGIGIAPAHFNRVFQIFQRLHPREEYEGTGIGLAISRKIVERHGGKMWVESVPDVGSSFFFTLPAGPPSSANGSSEGGGDRPVAWSAT